MGTLILKNFIYSIHFLRGIAVIQFFFQNLPAQKAKPQEKLGGYLCMILPLIPLAWGTYLLGWTHGFEATIIRYILRYLALWAYLRQIKKQPFRTAVVLDLVASLLFLCSQNLFIMPGMKAWHFGSTPLTPLHLVESFLVETSVELLIFALVRRNLQIHLQTSRHFEQAVFLLLLTLLECYAKGLNLKQVAEGALPLMLSLHGIVVGFLLLFQSFLTSERRREELQMAAVVQKYQYQNAKDRAESEQQIRRIYHDMKNHLLASQAVKGSSESRDYLENVLQELQQHELCVDTGNPFLDAFLSEKVKQCRQKKIPIQIHLDFREGNFISSMDLCTIFGNALDNALEASLSPDVPAEQKGIWIKAGCYHQMLVIKCCNYSGQKVMVAEGGELPQTSKTDTLHHGIGLFSIREALKKYQGTLSIHMEGDHYVVLAMMIPIPQLQNEAAG